VVSGTVTSRRAEGTTIIAAAAVAVITATTIASVITIAATTTADAAAAAAGTDPNASATANAAAAATAAGHEAASVAEPAVCAAKRGGAGRSWSSNDAAAFRGIAGGDRPSPFSRHASADQRAKSSSRLSSLPSSPPPRGVSAIVTLQKPDTYFSTALKNEVVQTPRVHSQLSRDGKERERTDDRWCSLGHLATRAGGTPSQLRSATLVLVARLGIISRQVYLKRSLLSFAGHRNRDSVYGQEWRLAWFSFCSL
jgi:hypothetical protein